MGTKLKQIALVTGAATGIGKAIVLELSSNGYTIIINYHSHKAEAQNLQDSLRAMGRPVEIYECDVTQQAQVEKMARDLKEKFGHVNVLVNNAGITRDHSLAKISIEEWEQVLSVNLTGAFRVTKEILPLMKDQSAGRIINIASVIGQTGAFGQSNYAASKAGLIGFTQTCALELARYHITVNAICPGYVETEMLSGVPAARRDELLGKIPLARFGDPAEIAKAVRFLVEDGSYITGQCLNLNGGLYLG